MSADRLQRLQRGIVDLSVFIHTEISNLAPDDSMEIRPDLNQVLELDPFEALAQVKRVVADLLKFKRDILLTREYEDFKTMQQYQSALQKLESEVRNHIKIEQQLKLHIENTQCRMEEMEKEHADALDRVRKEQNKGTEDGMTSREHGRREDKNKLLQETMQLRHAAKKEQQRALDLEKRIGRLEAEAIVSKSALHEKQRECEKLQKDLQKATSVAVMQHKENVHSTANLRPASGKKNGDEGSRPLSPLLGTSQSKLKTTQRSTSLERLKSGSRPLSAAKRRPKAA